MRVALSSGAQESSPGGAGFCFHGAARGRDAQAGRRGQQIAGTLQDRHWVSSHRLALEDRQGLPARQRFVQGHQGAFDFPPQGPGEFRPKEKRGLAPLPARWPARAAPCRAGG
eukprot:TRINITY_DN27522_c0_g1_i1.p1 TRINITY_DN27522_c0_g1~~TRINITY_DN27522_c0_g1_i1.p1  ORF type:complete len:113 (+),score=13.52 TRINITY_DN27522_c0_g1_i1:66-404(+)